ncbi:MAG: alpha-N-arabinofuranosidase, partial [Blautia sp.]|nr:alpha-N-arabinofuranosidase [Blautia sp.]
VFHQYVDHMDADLVESSISSPMVGKGGYEVPMVSQSVSVKEDGSLVMTLANCSAEESAPVDAVILGMPQGEICATIVSGDMHDKNTFEKPDEVTEKAFAGVERTKDGLSFSLPACSVVKILVKGA